MPKILILDHSFNIQSMSGCSSRYSEFVFHSINPKISISDNFDIINPDYILINQFFINNSITDVIKKLHDKTFIIDIPYIIPNQFARIQSTLPNNCVACIINNTDLKRDKVYKKDSRYYRIFNINKSIEHIQHYGSITSCKDLSTVILSHDYIIIDNPIFASLCSFYKKEYSYLHNNSDQYINDYKTNQDILNDILK